MCKGIPQGLLAHEPTTRVKVSPPEQENKEPPKQKSSIRKKRKNENVLFDYGQNIQSRASKRITAP